AHPALPSPDGRRVDPRLGAGVGGYRARRHTARSGGPPRPATDLTRQVTEPVMYSRTFQALLVPGDPGSRHPPLPYTSPFERWDDLASVRQKPRPEIPGPGGPEQLWFPPEMYPVALHPLVVAKGEATVRRLLLRRLQDYLSFTTELENFAVIPVATK